MLKCRLHNSLFSRTDARRDEDRSILGMRQEPLHSGCDLRRRKFAGTLHLHQARSIKQEDIPQCSKGVVPHFYVPLDLEQIGMSPFYGQATRIIEDIGLHALQLPFLAKNDIVIAILPQSWQVTLDNFFISTITSHFEAINHLAKMHRNPLLNKKNRMQVIWHQLERPDSNFGIVLGNIDKISDNSFAQCTRLHNGWFPLTITLEGSKQWAPFLDDQCNHVDTTALIVMPHAATLHRRFQLTSPLFLALISLTIHNANIPQLR